MDQRHLHSRISKFQSNACHLHIKQRDQRWWCSNILSSQISDLPLFMFFFFGGEVDRGLFQHHSSSSQSPPFSLAEPKISCTSVKYHWRQKSFSSLFNNQNQPNIISSHKAMSQVIKFPWCRLRKANKQSKEMEE